MAFSDAQRHEAMPEPAPPLSADPLVGWRIWRLERRDGDLTLVSMTRSIAWPPRSAIRAKCGRFERHPAPDLRCRCGIYATATVDDLARSGVFAPDAGVVGTTALWGTVVDHELGARGEFAYPARLRLVCGPCLNGGQGAVDPVAVVPRGETLLPMCARHQPKRSSGTAAPAADVLTELLANYAVDPLPADRVERGLRRRRLRLAQVLSQIAYGAVLAIRVTMLGVFCGLVTVFAWGLIAAVANRIAGR
jgi:hypothetical protein